MSVKKGQESKVFLNKLLRGKKLRFKKFGKDIYKRELVYVYLESDTISVNEVMVKSGKAIWDERYINNKRE